jgi:hypothetical protein
VQFVSVPGPVDASLHRTLDSDPALVRMSLSTAGGLWRLAQPAPASPPPSGGDSLHRIWLWAQATLLLVMLILASPGARAADAEEQYADVPLEEPRGRRRAGKDRVPV